ncbi:MAG: cell division ATP-binding protein FtsE [Clostridiales bacterium]|nr:cell division ATP-binding protein FtsE [Clostridiales bacterium]
MIRFDRVKKTYKSGVDALKGISFEIDDGEFVFVIGKSGSGKSTLMKCITREERPSEGKVYIDNFDISNMSRALVPVLRRQLGMVFQDFRLIPTKTVAENVAFAGEIIGVKKASLDSTVNLVLNIVGLKNKANCYPEELSGGEQQRVAIARAMLSNPKIIVADEPTGNLDPETSENIMALLLEINRSGTTVLVCTHDSNLVNKMKKRVIEIEQGYIVRDDEYGDYTGESNVANPLTADFGGYGIEEEKAEDYEDYMDEGNEMTEDYESSEEEEIEEPLANDQFSFGDEEEVKEEVASVEEVSVSEEVEVEEKSDELLFETAETNKEEIDGTAADEPSESWMEEISFDDIDLLDSEED